MSTSATRQTPRHSQIPDTKVRAQPNKRMDGHENDSELAALGRDSNAETLRLATLPALCPPLRAAPGGCLTSAAWIQMLKNACGMMSPFLWQSCSMPRCFDRIVGRSIWPIRRSKIKENTMNRKKRRRTRRRGKRTAQAEWMRQRATRSCAGRPHWRCRCCSLCAALYSRSQLMCTAERERESEGSREEQTKRKQSRRRKGTKES